MTSINHLISKHGVLVSFNIAKKVSIKDVKKIEKIRNESKSDEEYFAKLRKLMMMSVKNTIDKQLIPGIIEPKNVLDVNRQKYIESLTYSIVQAIKNKKLKKLEVVFMIQLLLNNLHITNEDFKNFYKNINPDFNDNDESEDDI